jgi:UDP-2-acetamido-3-amino-2,3-dideoxy-glucuronate N-acetyltransferase
VFGAAEPVTVAQQFRLSESGVVSARRPNIAVIGCGEWGKNLVHHFSRLGSLSAICDVSTVTTKRLGAELGVASHDFSQILSDPEVDAVAIATPAPLHAEHGLLALEAGKHVFIEKPLAMTVADGQKLVSVAKKQNRVLMVGHLMQYHPAFIALVDLIRGGQLGTIQYVYAHRTNIGTVRHEENVIWSLAPHDISMILAIFDAMPTKIETHTSCILQPGIADTATIHFEFPGKGFAHLFTSWLNPYKERKVVVVGSKAQAVFDDSLPWTEKLALYEHRVEKLNSRPVAIRGALKAIPVAQKDVLQEELQHFLDCISTGTKPRTGPTEALQVLKVLEAASPQR